MRVDWATHQATAYACKHWHYSGTMPPPPMVKIGCWEDDRFIGVVLFSRGANKHLLAPFGLTQVEGCELTRVALRDHRTPVTRIIAIAIKFLRRHCPGLRLIVSFADPDQGHVGTIYQAGGWIYTGQTAASFVFRERRTGRRWHPRMVSKHGTKRVFGWKRRVVCADQCDKIPVSGKHRYVLPLDQDMRHQVQALAKPYPKRAKQAMSGYHPPQRRCDTDPRAPFPPTIEATGNPHTGEDADAGSAMPTAGTGLRDFPRGSEWQSNRRLKPQLKQ